MFTIALFELGHHPVTPAIPRLLTFVFDIEIATFKLSKPCLTCSNRWSVFTIMILPANDDFPQIFSFDYIRKSNTCCKFFFFFFFSRTNVDIITKWYNTDAIVWPTQLLCVCRLMSGEQTDVFSSSYAMYYSVRSSLRKIRKDLCVHLVCTITLWSLSFKVHTVLNKSGLL